MLYSLYLCWLLFQDLRGGTVFPSILDQKGDSVIERLPKVSIIVPTRNSERTIGGCLDSLIALDYPSKEIIAVEGGSTDQTRRILDSYDGRITTVDEGIRPEGWVGKSWACHLGYQGSKGEFVLFTGADTLYAPNSLRTAMSALIRGSVDLLSLGPRIEFSSASERTILPLILMLIHDTLRRTKKVDYAIGEFILLSRANYERVGGHEAIRGFIDEDLRIAENAHKLGLKVRFMDGSAIFSMTMYNSLREIWTGFVRNFYGIISRSPSNFAELSVRELVSHFFPFVAAIISLAYFALGAPGILLTLLGCLPAIISVLRGVVYQRRLQLGMRYLLAMPAASVIVLGMLFVSLVRYAFRLGVPWRGRTYKTNRV